MEQKAKPQQSYFQTTLFACRAQYVNMIIEACVFAMSLAIYVNHYSLDTDIYDNWNRFPIQQITLRDEACLPNEENILQYSFPYTSVGCYCGDIEKFDSSVLQDDNCSTSELEQDKPCIEIEPIGGKTFSKWNSIKVFCGIRSKSTYKDVFENCDENCLKCNNLCPDLLQQAISNSKSLSIYEFTIEYENGNCYDKGKLNTNNYPLLQKAYECITFDSRLIGLDSQTQDKLFDVNDFKQELLKTLIGYEEYKNTPKFQLFASQFTIYNCSLPRIDIVSWRDNEIQTSSLIVLILSGLLLGIGAICFAGVISNLNKQGVLKRKSYLVNKKFYIPTYSNIFLYFITLVSIIVQIAFTASLIIRLQDYIDNQCSGWSSLQELENLKNFAKDQLLGYQIAALLFTILGQSLELFQLLNFTKKPLPMIGTPKFRKTTDHGNKFSIVDVPDDKSEKNVLQAEVLNTTSKNEILKKYQN